MSASNKPYTIVGTEVSLFTGKLRAYLRHKNIPFQQMLSTNHVYKRLILPKTGVSMIPVIVFPDEKSVMQDTKCIIDALERIHPEPPLRPSVCEQSKQRFLSDFMELWADEWAIMIAMHYRWSFPEQRNYMLYEFGRSGGAMGKEEDIIAVGKIVFPLK